MKKITFVNGQEPALNDTNLNQLQDNIEEAITEANTYSTEEQKIGTWIDGKPIYRKVIDIGEVPSKDTKIVSHNIPIETPISCKATFYREATETSYTDSSIKVNLWPDTISISTQIEQSYLTALAIIEYTKTTD